MLAGIVSSDDDADGAGVPRSFWCGPEGLYTIIDTWKATGLKRHRIQRRRDRRVCSCPTIMTLAVKDVAGGPAPGSDVNPGALFKLPMFALFPYRAVGRGALGNAQGLSRRLCAASRIASRLDLQPCQARRSCRPRRSRSPRHRPRSIRRGLIMRRICIEATEDAQRGIVFRIMAGENPLSARRRVCRQPLHRGGHAAVRRPAAPAVFT